MIIHTESDNPKSIEQKIKELILRKLYIKVRDEYIFVDKEEFISMILKDIIILARSKQNIDLALKAALKYQPEYKKIPDVRKNELQEALDEFKVEVLAYEFYLYDIENGTADDEMYMNVLDVLNSEHKLLEKKLHEIMMISLSRRVHENDITDPNVTKEQIVDVFANQVKLIASYDSIEESVEAAYEEFSESPNKHRVKKAGIKKEFERFSPLAQDEIKAYQFALNLEVQNAEFPAILAIVKQLLNI